jgi:hypothetical protein
MSYRLPDPTQHWLQSFTAMRALEPLTSGSKRLLVSTHQWLGWLHQVKPQWPPVSGLEAFGSLEPYTASAECIRPLGLGCGWRAA